MPTEQSASFNVDYHLGRFHRVSSRYGQAIQLHHRALMDLRESLGPDHPETLRSSTALANSFYAAGHFQEAIALFGDTLERRARTLGPEHPDTLRSRGSLGNCFHATGDYETAVSPCTNRPWRFEKKSWVTTTPAPGPAATTWTGPGKRWKRAKKTMNN